MKQRIVIQVQMTSDKSRAKAMGLVASTSGVESLAVEGREKNNLVVVGDGLDAVGLTTCLRKKVGAAQLVRVEVVAGGSTVETTRPATSTAVAAGLQQWPHPGYSYSYYCSSRPAAVHPYAGQYY